MSSVQTSDWKEGKRLSHCPSCGLEEEGGRTAPTFCSGCRFPLLLLGERYRLLQELAQGGFGTVYLAKDLQDERKVVVKVIKPELLQTESLLIRFRREIRVTTLLAEKNEHVVKILSHGEAPGLGHYYAMEFLDGMSLAEYLQHKRREEETFWIFKQFCEVMQEAHNEGIVHRDLKPDNLFLVTRHEDPLFVKVLDFGIAKPLEGTANDGLTSNAIGTPHYMAPEQCTNKGVDIRTDIYAMGIILYEMLTGDVPFGQDGDTPLSIVFAHITNPPPLMSSRCPNRSISPELDRVVLKAMEKKPEDRFQSALAMWEALQACPEVPSFAAGGPVLGPPEERTTVALRGGGTTITTVPSLSGLQARTERAKVDSGTIPKADLPTFDEGRGPTAQGFGPIVEKVAHPQTLVADLRGQSTTSEAGQASAEKGTKWVLWGGLGALFVLFLGVGGIWFTKHKARTTPQPSHPAKRLQPQGRSPQAPLRRLVQERPPLRRKPRRVAPSPRRPQVGGRVARATKVPPRRPVARRGQQRTRPQRRFLRVARRSARRPHAPQRPHALARRHRRCGATRPGTRWIYGKSASPAGLRLRVRLPGCRGCRVFRRSGGYCLLVPRSQGRLRVKLSAGGYQACTHWLTPQQRKLVWTLKGEDPDSLGGSSYYACFKEVP